MNLHLSDWNCPCRVLLWCMLTWYTLNLMLFLTSCRLFLVPLVSQLFSLSSLSGVHASTSSMGHMSRKSGRENWLCVLYSSYTVYAALQLTSKLCFLFIYKMYSDLNPDSCCHHWECLYNKTALIQSAQDWKIAF